MLKSTGSQRLYNWLQSVDRHWFDPLLLNLKDACKLSQLICLHDCQSTGEHWNQEDKRQECYLIDLESDRVFCLYRTSANLLWDLDCEVDFSPVLTK